MIKYILLDIHGVLTDGKERKRFLSFMEKKYGMNEGEHNSLWNNNVDSLDKKITKGTDYIKLINKTFNLHLSKKEYFDKFAGFIKVNKALLKKIESLKNYKVVIASDNVPELCADFNSLFGKTFKKLKKYYSFQLKSTKKEHMLSLILEKLDAKAEECLLIDDSSKNIEIARKLGVKTLHFESSNQLETFLHTR